MKKLLTLLILIGISNIVTAETYGLTSCAFGRDSVTQLIPKVYNGEDSLYSNSAQAMFFLCPEGGNYTFYLDKMGTGTLAKGEIDDSTGVITFTSILASSDTNRGFYTYEANSPIGLFRFTIDGYFFYESSYYVTHHQNYTQKNYTSGEEVYLPAVNYYMGNGDISFAYNGVTFANKSSLSNYGYQSLLVTIPDLDSTGMDYFTITNYNKSSYAQDQETAYLFYANECPLLNISSYTPSDKNGFIMAYKGTPTIFTIYPQNMEEGAFIDWNYNYGTSLQNGDSGDNSLSWTPTTDGKQYISAWVHNPVCDQLAVKTWTIYVNPELLINGKVSCNSVGVEVCDICYYGANKSRCTCSDSHGNYNVSLPEGLYNLSVNDGDYEKYNNTRNFTFPPYTSQLPVTIYDNIDLTSKNITGEVLIKFKTDNDCNGVYGDDLPNVSVNLYTQTGTKVLTMVDGIVTDYSSNHVLNYTYNYTTGYLNVTLVYDVRGYYFDSVYKYNYYPIPSQSTRFGITAWDIDYFGYTQYMTYWLDNLSCNYLTNYTIYTKTANAGVIESLGNVKITFYDYYTGDYVNVSSTNNDGYLQVNDTSKYINIKGTKTGYKSDSVKTEVINNVTLYLYPFNDTWDIKGSIYKCSDDYISIKDVTMNLYTLNNVLVSSTKTDGNGQFIFKYVEEGFYKLTYTKYGYDTKTLNINLNENWIDTQEDTYMCLNQNMSYCNYKIYLLTEGSNVSLPNYYIYVYERTEGTYVYPNLYPNAGISQMITKGLTDNEGIVEFFLPKHYNSKGNEFGYVFFAENKNGYYDHTTIAGISDINIYDVWTCEGYSDYYIYKYMTRNGSINYTSDIPMSEGDVFLFLEDYGFGIFLFMLLLFVTYISVLMIKDIKR